jgi:hypothetical protein
VFVDEAVFEKPLDDRVQGRRAQLHLPIGACGDFLSDGVSVLLPVSERNEHLKFGRGQSGR